MAVLAIQGMSEMLGSLAKDEWEVLCYLAHQYEAGVYSIKHTKVIIDTGIAEKRYDRLMKRLETEELVIYSASRGTVRDSLRIKPKLLNAKAELEWTLGRTWSAVFQKKFPLLGPLWATSPAIWAFVVLIFLLLAILSYTVTSANSSFTFFGHLQKSQEVYRH